MNKKILIVDDSALMRKLLREIFESEGYEVATARNGVEAIEMNNTFQPDIITLDINMPDMDGLTALSHIMIQRPVPVIMVSSLTEEGALATFEALNLGAIDYVTKPGGTISLNIDKIRDELLLKVNAALKSRLRTGHIIRKIRAEREKITKAKTTPLTSTDEGVVLIGSSTGGPRTLEEILQELPEDFSLPVVVAQHMPATFTKSFAERLNAVCKLNVTEVNRPLTLERGNIYIGKGEADVVITRRTGKLMVQIKPENPKFLWHPSVEVLGRSALENIDPRKIIAVMLTGMGYDGSDAFAEIMKRGGKTIAESEETAVVFGMPRELIEKGGATVILPAQEIPKQIIKWAKNFN
ncbi:protein-glutamate methylesterase/protein-glutamine glutaminase [Thermodesulfovibrio yellowstonii]|uniref:protein-glutamate methylesterase/protein-glutamine glutaminase n=1 Tax=Thermodesulfovibrio yellowstonii TaxID=28262 RepID=UPI0004055275|nr:chemotaxis response regulator protein-glutamate methylesterase [Thermodesulfovibrio islandicus]